MDATAAPPPPVRALKYDGRIGELYRIFLVNILLTVVTLGIYKFWAVTRYRRYFWSRMAFQGQRFEYTGTGGQLFVGFLLAGLVLLAMLAVALGLAYVLPDELKPLPIVVLYAAVAVLAAGAVFSAQRYRLSRSAWCGIHGGMTGSALAYGVRVILYWLLAMVTLFQMHPWMQIRLSERRINASSFGTAQFGFRGRARSVYGVFLMTIVATWVLFALMALGLVQLLVMVAPALLAVPDMLFGAAKPSDIRRLMEALAQVVWVVAVAFVVFGILSALIGAWYQAVLARHVIGHTTLASVRFASSVAGPSLAGLILGNLLILLFTLGLGYPIVLHRNAQFLSRTLWTQGAIDPKALGQSTLRSSPYGEGMFQQLDAGAAL